MGKRIPDWTSNMTIAMLVVIAVLLIVALGHAYDQIEEYEYHEVYRLMDECERCRRKEEVNWVRAAEERRDQLTACEDELDKMKLEWHPAHISPHTEEACKGYACWKDEGGE